MTTEEAAATVRDALDWLRALRGKPTSSWLATDQNIDDTFAALDVLVAAAKRADGGAE